LATVIVQTFDDGKRGRQGHVCSAACFRFERDR
jgi:hypothetical protein